MPTQPNHSLSASSQLPTPLDHDHVQFDFERLDYYQECELTVRPAGTTECA